nr:MAG TPA: hypothetical protein [Caudoviricetes sp.]
MTIIEQILAALQQKFSGVDTAILSRIANKKGEGVTDEGKVNSIVEGIGFQDVLNSYGDFRADGAASTAVKNYERKYNLKDGKAVDEPKPTPTPAPTNEPQDIAKLIADAVSAAVSPLSDKLTQFEAAKARETRGEQILAKAKEYGIPDSIAKRYAIPDDADLDSYFKDAKQELANAGFNGIPSPESSDAKIEKENASIAKMINEGTKSIVEQNK